MLNLIEYYIFFCETLMILYNRNYMTCKMGKGASGVAKSQDGHICWHSIQSPFTSTDAEDSIHFVICGAFARNLLNVFYCFFENIQLKLSRSLSKGEQSWSSWERKNIRLSVSTVCFLVVPRPRLGLIMVRPHI